MSKYLVTFQTDNTHYDDLHNTTVYGQSIHNEVVNFQNDLPTKDEIEKIRHIERIDWVGDFIKITRNIIFMQKLAD